MGGRSTVASWIATKYAWTCSHPLPDGTEVIKGSVKLVLLAIAALVPKNHAETPLVRLATLVKMTGLEERQVRRCRDLLARLREIEVCHVGKRARYGMVGMAGPLFAFGAEDPDKMSGFLRVIERWESGHLVRIRFNPDKMSGSPVRTSAFRNDVRTTEHNNNNHHPVPAEVIAQVHTLFDWWVEHFPLHNDGVTTTADIEEFGPVARELLTKHRLSVEDIQAMARFMWSVRDVRDHTWIPTTDYSIKVLRETSDWLRQRSGSPRAATSLDPWHHRVCPHDPACSTFGDCLNRILADGRAAREAAG